MLKNAKIPRATSLIAVANAGVGSRDKNGRKPQENRGENSVSVISLWHCKKAGLGGLRLSANPWQKGLPARHSRSRDD
jgi:hypothetical protein